MRHVPEIKLIRTDTTLDLSQKAEKVWLAGVALPLSMAMLCYFCCGSSKLFEKWNKQLHHFAWLRSAATTKKLKQRVPNLRKKIKREKNVCKTYIFSESLNAGWISCDRCNKASLHIKYPVWNLSRLQMIHGSSNLALLCAPRKCVWSWPEGYRNFNRWEHPKHHAC